MRMPLPLIPLQILWMNLVTDSFPALTMVFEKEEEVMKTKPRQEKSILDGIWRFIIVGGALNFIACFAIYLIGMGNGIAIENIRAMVLTTGILFELFFIYTCRSSKPLTEIGIFSNKWLNYAIIFSLAMQFILLYTPLAGIFKVAPLTLMNWLLILPFAVSGLIIFEIGKYIKHKK
jgi:Ca2+-transporting ATPase